MTNLIIVQTIILPCIRTAVLVFFCFLFRCKKEYEARGLNTSTEESDNSLINIIQSKLDLSDITSALLYVCMILIAFLIADYLSDLVVRFFYSAHDETEYPDDYCSDEDWQEYLEEKAFRDNR